MKKYSFILIFLLSISIIGTPHFASADGENWLPDWDYRKAVNLIGSAGAGTDYQVFIHVNHSVGMQNDWDDIRFTTADGITELDYWREFYFYGIGEGDQYGWFWVEVTDNLDTNQTIYMYYGNDDVSTTSNGHTTFQEFYDKTNTTGWGTTNGITVTTSGDYLRFYDSDGDGSAAVASRSDLVVSDEFEFMSRYKTVSVSGDDQGLVGIKDGSDYFSVVYAPQSAAQTDWYYHDGSSQKGGDWAEGTEYIFTTGIDEGDSANGIDYRQYDTDRILLDSALNKAFGTGSPTDTDTFVIGTGTGFSELDLYMLWGAFRKRIVTEPVFDSFGEVEEAPPRSWNTVAEAELIFPIGWDPVAQFGYDAVFIFAGLILIPVSTIYLVRGGRKDFSSDKLFYFLIMFMVGLGLLVGGIMP